MDWQTKEYMDERFDDLQDKMDLLLQNSGIDQDNEDDSDEDEDEDNSDSEELI